MYLEQFRYKVGECKSINNNYINAIQCQMGLFHWKTFKAFLLH